jgi:predicted PurR-regulated permease PerM
VSRYLSFITLLAVIVLLIVLFYKVMAGFFVPLFLAALLVVIFRPWHLWIIERCKGRLKLAALLTTTGIMLSVLVPLAVLFVLAAFEGQQLMKSLNRATLIRNINDIRNRLNLTMPELAKEIRAIEIQLDNIAQIDRLEYVANLNWQLRNISLYNDDLSKVIDQQQPMTTAWQQYLGSFEKIRDLQRRIANPDLQGNAEEGIEPDDPGVLFHDFQGQFAKARQDFDHFKVAALGGSAFWVWLREMANPTPELLEQYGSAAVGYARQLLVNLGASTTSFVGRLLLGIAIMVIALYFFLLDGPKLLKALKRLSPINDEHEQELIEEFGKVSRAVVVATLLAALVQALLGGIGYYFCGLQSVFLLTLLTGCLALVPFVGAAAVWLPCALWLYFVDNNFRGGIGLAVYGALIISMSDNLIKPLVLHGQSKIHPLFALLSVLGGVATLGPIGILIGPMVIAFLQTLLTILQQELVAMDRPNSG